MADETILIAYNAIVVAYKTTFVAYKYIVVAHKTTFVAYKIIVVAHKITSVALKATPRRMGKILVREIPQLSGRFPICPGDSFMSPGY